MTKQQHQRAKDEIALARKATTHTETFINASAAMLHFAWHKQQARLAARSEVTQGEIRAFCGKL